MWRGQGQYWGHHTDALLNVSTQHPEPPSDNPVITSSPFSKLHHSSLPFLSSVLSTLPQFSQAPWMTHMRPSAPPLPSPVTPKQRYPEPQTTGQSDYQHLLLPKTTPTVPALIRHLSFCSLWLSRLFKNLYHCYLFSYYTQTHTHNLILYTHTHTHTHTHTILGPIGIRLYIRVQTVSFISTQEAFYSVLFSPLW